MAKKILIIGPDFYGYNEGIAEGFTQLGYEVKIFPTYLYSNSFVIRAKKRIDGLMGKTVLVDNIIKSYNNKIMAIYSTYKPDIVLELRGEVLTPDSISSMKNSIRILWMLDSIFTVSNAVKNVSLFDARFMFEKTDVDALKLKGITSYFIPDAFDNRVYFPLNNKRDIDILFVGALRPERIKLIKSLMADFPKLKIRAYGKYVGLFSFKRRFDFYIKKEYKVFANKNVGANIVNELYSRTKIAINNHHAQSQYGCNMRFFEILATKTFQLVDENTYIKETFGDKVVCYKDYEDLREKIVYYIDNQEKRDTFANIGYEEVIKHHSFKYRAQYMLELIGSVD